MIKRLRNYNLIIGCLPEATDRINITAAHVGLGQYCDIGILHSRQRFPQYAAGEKPHIPEGNCRLNQDHVKVPSNPIMLETVI